MLQLPYVLLAFYHDSAESEAFYRAIEKDSLLDRLKALNSRATRKGLGAVDPNRNRLIRIGMEVNESGAVTKNGYGVFDLSWQAEHHSEWAGLVESEVRRIREAIREKHGSPLRFVIWVGVGGSAEDKNMYSAAGLLKRGPHFYALDSTDPAKLKAILADMARRSKLPMAAILRGTLVAGMATGMTSYEPLYNLSRLAALYDRHKVDSRVNFMYIAPVGSPLDRFGAERVDRKVELQLDGRTTTAGRHAGPLTRGSLYALAFCGVDLSEWIRAAVLSEEEIYKAWRLSAFLHAQGVAGRDKVTLMLPKEWSGAALWTKQDFEESLGKCESLGIKIAIDEKVRLTNYRPPKDARQDRVFLAVQVKGLNPAEAQKVALLRRTGYPVATLILPRDTPLARYMQFIHYAAFGVAYLRDMNFVTQPGVELFKTIANRLHAQAEKAGGIEKTREWRRMRESPRQAKWRRGVTLIYDRIAADRLPTGLDASRATAPEIYAALLGPLAVAREVEYAELTFFGDTRYSSPGRALRVRLHRAAESLFRARLKMPVDVYEGPAMNHSYHEMIAGHGKCFSTVLLCEDAESIPAIGYTADYNWAQFLAAQMALSERGRPVVSILLKDLDSRTLDELDEFFRQAAKHV
jgi:glucose-6-phosphate isomerase